MADIEKFIATFQEYKEEQENQKRRGLNDFNIFTTLLNKSDEVRLHSRFLHFLLNPSADHSQGSLFLDLFLKECNLYGFFENTERCSVYKEHKFIDLYITDGSKHLVIENKIFAGDQDRQIQRYIDTIIKDNLEDISLSDNLVVIYLSLNRNQPAAISLGDFTLDESKSVLVRKCEKYQFKAIAYDTHVFNWIDKSHAQIVNISNLAVGLTQYKDVILKLYGRYKGKVMSLEEFMEGRLDKQELYKMLKEVSSEYQLLRKSLMNEFFDKVIVMLEAGLDDENWAVIEMEKLRSGNRYGFPLRIEQVDIKKPMVLLGFEFTQNNFGNPDWGIVRRDESVKFSDLRDDSEIKELLGSLQNILTVQSQWWLKHEILYKGDFCEKVVGYENIDMAAEDFSANFLKIFHNCKELVSKCNVVQSRLTQDLKV